MPLSNKSWTDLFRTRKRLDQLIKSIDPEQLVPWKLKHIKDLVWDFEHLPSIPPMPFQDGLVSGGRVTWIANYDYEVSAAVYIIGGVVFNSPLTMITLSPADGADDRIDTFILTTNSTAEVIEGTPSSPPVLEPDVDPVTQLRIAFALVSAGTTEPTLPLENVYLENTEWVTAVSNASWNPASLNNPYADLTDIEGTAVANGHFITFTPASFPSLITFDSLVFKIRSKATWGGASRLNFRFFNGTTAIGNNVIFGEGSLGFVSSQTTAYQNMNIDLALFGNIAAATNLRITKSGGGTIGFYLDNIQLVGNGNVVTVPQVQADWAQTNSAAASFIRNKPTIPLRYVANLTQTGVSAPVITLMLNTLGATVSSAYSGPGDYQLIASSNVFTAGKTTVLLNNNRDDAGNSNANTSILATNTIVLSTQDATLTPTDAILTNCTIVIEVWP